MMMSRMQMSRRAIGKLVVLTSLGVSATAAQAQGGLSDVTALQSPETNQALSFRYIGPLGNRVSSVAGVIGNPRIYYAGAASGGIFKSIDGGTTWQAIFDRQPVSSVGSLCGGCVECECGVGGHGRDLDSQQHFRGLGHLQVHRCGQDVAARGPSKTAAGSAAS